MSNPRQTRTRGAACAVLALSLVACSNDDNGSNRQQDAQLQRAQNNAALENYLKEGLKQAVASNGTIQNLPAEVMPDNESPDSGVDGDNPGVSLGFSTTNLIEQGVDEPDAVKFDGKNIYIAAPAYQYCIELCEPMPIDIAADDASHSSQTSNAIRVMLVSDPAHSATEIARISIPASDKYDNETLDGLLLSGDESQLLVSMMQASNYTVQDDADMAWSSIWAWTQGGTIIDTFDVTQPAQATHRSRIDMDGHLVTARRIGDSLHVITRFTPTIATGGAQDTQLAQIDAMTLDQLLPTVTIDGETSLLVEAQDCFIDATAAGYPTLMVVTTIDLRDNDISSSCVTANLYNAYLSKNAIYLSQIEWSTDNTEQTHIYKFVLQQNGSSYRGEGVVDGSLAGNQNFALNEYNDVLRVVTHEWSSDGQIINRLYTLEDDGAGNLRNLATLPNDQRPAAIGKPGETIQGVRFVDDYAYVVTFLQTDPLYVIDLRDPRDPFIAGEVEIPGFSTILQPLPNRLLLGVGSEDNLLKAELYDVATASNPRSLGKYLLNEDGATYSHSPARWDHQALTVLPLPDDTVRVALPYYSSQYINGIYGESKGALSLLVDTNERRLTPVAKAPVAGDGYAYGTQRVVLHDSTLHYIEGTAVWSSVWGSSNPLTTAQ